MNTNFHPDCRVPIQTWTNDIEQGALEQAMNLAKHPCTFRFVAVMPDVHQGYGMPIGGVVAFKDAVSPNCVGVDIGCGVVAVKTSAKYNVEFASRVDEIRERIENEIPIGKTVHETPRGWHDFIYLYQNSLPWCRDDDQKRYFERGLGTLGGGNHFIDLQRDPEGHIWIMIHSGSRKLGHTIGTYHHRRALELNQMWHSRLPDNDLAFYPEGTMEAKYYIQDMLFAIQYAMENRRRLMNAVKEIIWDFFPEIIYDDPIDSIHNFAVKEHHLGHNVWVHRKGATPAREGEIGIIPGSMGTNSYIVRGLGSPMSFMSCSHGAGRRMGRREACSNLSWAEAVKAMEGISFKGFGTITIKGKEMIDLSEAPGAYKDIETVIDEQADLVEPLVQLTPIMVVVE